MDLDVYSTDEASISSCLLKAYSIAQMLAQRQTSTC